jgi:hypothetical protein
MGAGLFILLAALPCPREFRLGIDQRKPAGGFPPSPARIQGPEILNEHEGLLIDLALDFEGGYPGISGFQQLGALSMEARQKPVVPCRSFIGKRSPPQAATAS